MYLKLTCSWALPNLDSNTESATSQSYNLGKSLSFSVPQFPHQKYQLLEGSCHNYNMHVYARTHTYTDIYVYETYKADNKYKGPTTIPNTK